MCEKNPKLVQQFFTMPSQMKLKIYFNYIFVVMITLTLLEIGDTKQLYGKNLHQIVKKTAGGFKIYNVRKIL